MLKRHFDLAIAHKLATSFALNQNGQRIQAPKRRMPAIRMLTSHRVLSLSRHPLGVLKQSLVAHRSHPIVKRCFDIRRAAFRAEQLCGAYVPIQVRAALLPFVHSVYPVYGICWNFVHELLISTARLK